MDEENGRTRPGTGLAAENPQEQTVWLRDSEAIRQEEDNLPESHWSRQTTQPFAPRWPAQVRQRLAARRAAAVPGSGSRALWVGAGWGVLLTLVVLSLLLLLIITNSGSSGSSDSSQWPIPVQSVPHTPVSTTNVPTSSALPTVTAQPTATALPTQTPVPTATPSPPPRPTATP